MKQELLDEYLSLAKEIDELYSMKVSVVIKILLYVSIGVAFIAGLVISLSRHACLGLVLLFISMSIMVMVNAILFVKNRKNKKIIKQNRLEWSFAIHRGLRKLLKKYGIDYADPEKMNEIISDYSAIRDSFSLSGMFKPVHCASTLAVIPVVAYVLRAFASSLDFETLINTAILWIILVMAFSFAVSVFQYSLKELPFGLSHNYNMLISDLREVLLFSKRDIAGCQNSRNDS